MKTAWFSALLLVLLAWTGAAQAETVIYKSRAGESVFSVTYPESWTVEYDFDKPLESAEGKPPPRIVEAMPGDGSRVWLGVWVPPYVEDIEDAPGYMQSLEQYILNDVKSNDPVSQSLNGMAALVIKGTALKDKQPVEWVMAFFQASESAVGAAFYVGVVEDKQRHQRDFDALIDSIRPVR
jgi:hypothetical protein